MEKDSTEAPVLDPNSRKVHAIELALTEIYLRYNKIKPRVEAKFSQVAAVDILRYKAFKEVIDIFTENGVETKMSGGRCHIRISTLFGAQDPQFVVKEARRRVNEKFRKKKREK